MDIVNHSAGLITSFHMLDAVVRVISDEDAFINIISGVLCIADTLL